MSPCSTMSLTHPPNARCPFRPDIEFETHANRSEAATIRKVRSSDKNTQFRVETTMRSLPTGVDGRPPHSVLRVEKLQAMTGLWSDWIGQLQSCYAPHMAVSDGCYFRVTPLDVDPHSLAGRWYIGGNGETATHRVCRTDTDRPRDGNHALKDALSQHFRHKYTLLYASYYGLPVRTPVPEWTHTRDTCACTRGGTGTEKLLDTQDVYFVLPVKHAIGRRHSRSARALKEISCWRASPADAKRRKNEESGEDDMLRRLLRVGVRHPTVRDSHPDPTAVTEHAVTNKAGACRTCKSLRTMQRGRGKNRIKRQSDAGRNGTTGDTEITQLRQRVKCLEAYLLERVDAAAGTGTGIRQATPDVSKSSSTSRIGQEAAPAAGPSGVHESRPGTVIPEVWDDSRVRSRDVSFGSDED
ncbi:hypothetical protein LXA43DRAFT_1066441 [Ganoderma leucocontextum]|nr:hypothetical protein LXA43DRAFT_1066441 [Ganoderma leucocontextum]